MCGAFAGLWVCCNRTAITFRFSRSLGQLQRLPRRSGQIALPVERSDEEGNGGAALNVGAFAVQFDLDRSDTRDGSKCGRDGGLAVGGRNSCRESKGWSSCVLHPEGMHSDRTAGDGQTVMGPCRQGARFMCSLSGKWALPFAAGFSFCRMGLVDTMPSKRFG